MLLVSACKRPPDAPSNSSSDNLTFYTSPPFSTKEPERYQATRTTTLTESASDNTVNNTHTIHVLIVRAGNQRREEHKTGTQGTVVFLENQSGRFILLPQAKLYADANETSASIQVSQLQVEAELTSPDLLLNEAKTAVQYQKLGAEVIAGRTARKYKVVNSNSNSSNENFVWVDETLGMPIATQYTSNNGNISTRVFSELQNIRTEVDPKAFVLPTDYRKVAAAEILALIRAGRVSPR